MHPVVAHALVTSPGVTPERWMLFLHGILGSGANWRGFARRLVAARPRWGAVLVDLRMHGASQGFRPPHTVAAAAEDLLALDGALPVRAVVGHSFGGKVALEYLARRGDALEQVWILDAMPGARPAARGSEVVLNVLELLEAMDPVVPSREAFIAHVQRAGYSQDIAQWLAMNLRPAEGGYVLRVDLRAIRALLEDYFARDLWPVIEERRSGTAQVHLVIAGRSTVFDPSDRERAVRAAAASGGRVKVHVLPEAGHWVHVDDPEGLLAAMLAALPD